MFDWMCMCMSILRVQKIQTSVSGTTQPSDLKFGMAVKPKRSFLQYNFRQKLFSDSDFMTF